jgi:hypothetical protein
MFEQAEVKKRIPTRSHAALFTRLPAWKSLFLCGVPAAKSLEKSAQQLYVLILLL